MLWDHAAQLHAFFGVDTVGYPPGVIKHDSSLGVRPLPAPAGVFLAALCNLYNNYEHYTNLTEVRLTQINK